MKLGDKLYQLRKKQGLSQGELGDKLNVTRQTISKWELGQSKPESDKLIEMSKLFNISLEELTDDDITLRNNTFNEAHDVDEQRPRKWVVVVLIILAIIIAIVLVNKVVMDKKSSGNSSRGIFDWFNSFNNTSKDSFNYSFEFYSGTKYGVNVSHLLDDVITNNKTNKEYIVSVVYQDVNTNNSDEIKALKSKFVSMNEYEVSLDYDENGFVNIVTIEDIEKDITAKSFNRMMEFYSGTKYGSSISYLLDEVIKSNNTNKKHIIVVNYGTFSSSDVNEIRDLKKNFDTWTSYEVWLSYDVSGYVYQVNIES